ncbi:GNAT family N-acetyltransferase [Microbispora sp. ATCC PTA-5024]|uniref:GNAT family N-acetyltransferase n=1 Tax=Microbispora sp. ATCC PTA-5024 TaxID=316330 RepID=UPI0003DD4369|nr:GNAT family N-acetyltransferase [Microbispora sp. ATCC PTA-5024]ETK34361.1 N-acetyltransferase GCN5 [Microbispora sp. ATCC PTA-5024]
MSDTGVRIRAGRLDEIEAVLEFWLLAAENTDRHDSAEGVRRLMERDPEALMVAEIDGRLVGTLIAGWDGWRAHLYRLAVHPGHRRRGVARALIDAAEARFARFGAVRSDAMVLDANVLAHQAWTAAGYGRQTDCSRWVRSLRF